jgi:hypothetical protein
MDEEQKAQTTLLVDLKPILRDVGLFDGLFREVLTKARKVEYRIGVRVGIRRWLSMLAIESSYSVASMPLSSSSVPAGKPRQTGPHDRNPHVGTSRRRSQRVA